MQSLVRFLLPAAVAAMTLAALGCSTSEKATKPSPGAHAVDCAGASLALAGETVVATFDGQPVTVKDLGDEVANAERRALFEYCDTVHSLRTTAVDNLVVDRLIKKAAAAAGKSEEEWVRGEVQKRAPEPSDAEVQAFYDTRKRPDAPPLELVRAQVVDAIQREKGQDALRQVVDDLKKGVAVEKSLPDVRSPPRDVNVTAHTATKGKAGAKVRLVEFADFQCPYCSIAAKTMSELAQKYGDRVEFAYRHFPLRSIHPNAQRAAEFAQCANEQGKFWEMHDKLYEGQDSLDESSMRTAATVLGLDATKLDECLGSGRATTQVDEDFKSGEDIGVQGTPSFFINGRQHAGAPSVEALAAALDAELR